jgi:cytochrome c peroxidase
LPNPGFSDPGLRIPDHGSRTTDPGPRIPTRIQYHRKMLVRALVALLMLGALAGSVREQRAHPVEPFAWHLPPGVPRPKVPGDNPMSEAKVRLGRRLFYDTRLSGNGTFACASCHQQKRAFTDGLPRAVGSTGQQHARSAMSLANVAFNASYGWADARTRTLEAQMAVPMFNEHPIEMGMKGNEATIVARIAADSTDAAMFREAFPEQPVALDTIVKAIASFERTIVSANSPLDWYLYRDDRSALTPQAQRGMALFFSDRLACAQCHAGFNLSGPTVQDRGADVAPTFHNTGLYNIDGRGRIRRSIAAWSTRPTWPRTWAAFARRRSGTSR